MAVWRLRIQTANHSPAPANRVDHRAMRRDSTQPITRMHTCKCLVSPSFFLRGGALFTQPLLDSILIKLQSNGGGKHFAGRTKNHSPLLTTQTYIKSYDSVSAFLCFIYIYKYIYIDYFSMSVLICLFFSLFYTLLKLLESGFKKTMLFICLSVCLSLWSSLVRSSCRVACVCVSVCPYPPPALHFHQSVLLLCLILTTPSHLSSLPLFFHVTWHLCDYSITKFVPPPRPDPGTVWTFTVQRLCGHNSFIICNKAMQNPGQALPLVDVCRTIFFKKQSFRFFFLSVAYCWSSRTTRNHKDIFSNKGDTKTRCLKGQSTQN